MAQSRLKPRPPDPNRGPGGPGGGAPWKMLLLIVLLAALTIGHLAGGGTAFPTLVDFFTGR
ncbi:MAG: hypothetical protein IH626_07200 [Rhodospirillales bacterium]|nr:hypothetical protein [Rhodospirillales bacterium]